MEKIDFVASFYNSSHDRVSLIKGIASLLLSNNLIAYAIPFGSHFPFKNILSKPTYKRKIALKYENAGVQLYELTYKSKEIGEEKSGRFFIFEHPDYTNVYVALTIDGREFYHQALLPFLQRQYPKIILTFIGHQ